MSQVYQHYNVDHTPHKPKSLQTSQSSIFTTSKNGHLSCPQTQSTFQPVVMPMMSGVKGKLLLLLLTVAARLSASAPVSGALPPAPVHAGSPPCAPSPWRWCQSGRTSWSFSLVMWQQTTNNKRQAPLSHSILKQKKREALTFKRVKRRWIIHAK